MNRGERGKRACMKESRMAGWYIRAEEMYLMSDLSSTSSQNNGLLYAIVFTELQTDPFSHNAKKSV